MAQAHDYTSPFFNIFTYVPLAEFSDDDALALIDRGVKSDRPFSEGERNQMSVLGENHPYKLQLAGSLIYNAKANDEVIDWDALRAQFEQQLEQAGLKANLKRNLKKFGEQSKGTVFSGVRATIQEVFKAILGHFFP